MRGLKIPVSRAVALAAAGKREREGVEVGLGRPERTGLAGHVAHALAPVLAPAPDPAPARDHDLGRDHKLLHPAIHL